MIEIIVGAIVAIVGVFFYGKSQGKKEEYQSKNKRAVKVEDKIQSSSDDDIDRMASKWVRNKKK